MYFFILYHFNIIFEILGSCFGRKFSYFKNKIQRLVVLSNHTKLKLLHYLQARIVFAQNL
jgi:hypothetical protein